MSNEMDIVYVTYNSGKWLASCLSSLLRSDYDLKKIKVTFVDNASTDNTVPQLHKLKSTYQSKFAGFEILCLESNLGFGFANNIGAQIGTAPIVCFFNIDTELHKDTLAKIDKIIATAAPDVAMWELHQLPYEHPKAYDIQTEDTSWCSGAAMLIRRKVFNEVHGFESQLFMYAEDVDISWRIRSKGYRLKYCPEVFIQHHCYEIAGEVKPLEYVYSFANNLLLRYRYGNVRQQLVGHLLIYKAILRNNPYPQSRKQLWVQYIKNLRKIKYFKSTRVKGPEFIPYFKGLCYCKSKIQERNQS